VSDQVDAIQFELVEHRAHSIDATGEPATRAGCHGIRMAAAAEPDQAG
jgi:hypothetical protein